MAFDLRYPAVVEVFILCETRYIEDRISETKLDAWDLRLVPKLDGVLTDFM